MTPEATTNADISGRIIHVPAPTAGQAGAIDSAGASAIRLDFNPSDANESRSGNNLVFETDNGGRVTLTDFFAVGDKPLPLLTLPDGTAVKAADIFTDMDLSTAAGPGGGTAAGPAPNGGGEGEYADNPGALLSGVEKLDSLGTVYWDRSTEDMEIYHGAETVSLSMGIEAALFQTRSLNESDAGTSLNFSFSAPLPGQVTLTFQVDGNATAYGKTGTAEFFADYEIDVANAEGCTATFAPDTGTLIIVIPAGSTGVSVPILLLDDHINDGAKNILITLAPGGVQGDVIISGNPNLEIAVSDDSSAQHDHDQNNPHETAVLDGPIAGIESIGESTLYEGDPKGNTFLFALTLTDPHSGLPYEGYTGRSGSPDMLMSQDMDVYIRPDAPPDGATYGQDYVLRPSAALADLKAAGMLDYTLNDDGNFVREADGSVKITLFGRVDANGLLHETTDGTVPFHLDDTGGLTVEAVVLINGRNENPGEKAGEKAEEFSLAVARTEGNESQVQTDADARAVIGADPRLGLEFNANGVNESLEHFSLALNFDQPIGANVEYTAVIKISGEALLWDGDPEHRFLADFFLPGMVTMQGDKVVSTLFAGGSPVTLTYDPAAGTLTVSGTGASFPLSLDFPLNDDHISENLAETVTFTLEKITLNDGNSQGDVGIDPDQGSATLSINDDSSAHTDPHDNHEDGVLDGPLVGLAGTADTLYEGDHSVISVTLTDPHSGNDYEGYDEGLMSQDMRLTFSVIGTDKPGTVENGAVEYGVDYVLRPTADLMDVLHKYLDADEVNALVKTDAGGNLYIALDADGCFSILLPGRVGADGTSASAGREAFDLTGDLGKLTFLVDVLNDDLTERVPGTIDISVKTDGKNESLTGADASLRFDVEEGSPSGPIVGLYGPDSVTESGLDDGWLSPRNNHAEYEIRLDKPAAEDIRISVGIEPLNAESKDSGPNADYTFNGMFLAHFPDGSIQMAPAVFENSQWLLTIPKGADKILFSTEIIDDLREIPSETDEGYTVSFDLIKTDGMTDGEARIEPGKNRQQTIIEEDLRSGPNVPGAPLGPMEFDGPFVMLSGSAEISESSGVTKNGLGSDPAHNTAEYTIRLYDPSGSGALYAADEPVVVTLTLTLDTASAADLDLRGWTAGNAGQYTRDFTLAKGESSLTVRIPLVDDHITEGAEQYSLQITGIYGNEARLWDNTQGAPPAGYETDGRYAGDEVVTVITEDAPDFFDGPLVGIAGAAATGTEGQTMTFDITLKDPAGSGDDYSGFNNEGNLLQDMTFTVRLGGENGGVYGEDFRFNADQPNLTDMLANGWLKADPDTGKSYTLTFDGNGNAYLSVTVNAANAFSNAPTTLAMLREYLKVSVDVLDDAGGPAGQRDNNGEAFSLSIADVSGNEARADGDALTVTIEDNNNGVFVNIYGGRTVVEGQDLPFYLTISNTRGGAHLGADAVSQDIAVEITFTQSATGGARFSGKDPTDPTATKADSRDYDLSALEAKLNAVYGEGSATLAISGDGLKATLHLNIAPEHWGTAGSHTGGFKLEIPSLQDLFGEGAETVTATITGISGAEARIGMASATDTLKDDVSLKLSLSGEPVIYEDNDHGRSTAPNEANADGTWNTALYTVDIARQFPADWPSDGHPVENFTFRISLADGANPGGATYDGIITDDVRNIGDYRWGFQEDLYARGLSAAGNLSQNRTGTGDALCKAITDWLHDRGYLPEGVAVSGIVNGGRTLIFTVSTDYTFSAVGDIKVPVTALDDALTEGDEYYTVTLSNVSGHEASGSGSVKTVIKDDTGDFRDGFRVGVEPDLIFDESSGSAQYINLMLYDKAGNPLTDVPALSRPVTVTLRFGVDGLDNPAEMFSDYRPAGINPVRVVEDGREYWQIQVEIPADGWHLENGKVVAGIPVQVVDDKLSEGDERFTVDLIDVQGNEMSRLLDDAGNPRQGVVTVRDDYLLPDEANLSHNEWSADGRLVKPGLYDETDRSGAHVLDGPKFLFFIQNEYRVYEPSLPGKPSSDAYNTEPGKVPDIGLPETGLDAGHVHYTIGFDGKVTDEPLLITLSLGGDATLGRDFMVEDGLGYMAHNGSITLDGVVYTSFEAMWAAGHNGAALPAYMEDKFTPGGWFVIVEPGRASAEFSIKILPDHLKDDGETIAWQITGMSGNEVIFAPETKPDGSTSDTLTTVILDDGDGPRLSLTCDDRILSSHDAADTAHYTLDISSRAGEDYTATFRIVLGENMYPDDIDSITVNIAGIAYTATLDADRSTSGVRYYNLAIPGGFSGEADVYLHAAQSGVNVGKTFYFGLDGTDGYGESSADTGLIPGRIEGPGGQGGSSTLLSLDGGGSAVEGSDGTLSGVDAGGVPERGVTFTVSRVESDGDYGRLCTVALKVLLGEGCTYPGDFQFGDNVAVFPQDGYLSLFVVIPAGQQSVDFNALFFGDNIYEGNESFTVLLTGGGVIDLDKAMRDAVIIDDDASRVNVSLSLNPDDMTTHNGDTGFYEGTNAVFHLNLEAAVGNNQSVLSNDVEVTFTYTPDTAALGGDFIPITHTVVIPAGTSIAAASSWPVYISLPDNELEDGARSFSVHIDSVAGLNGGAADTTPRTIVVLDDAGTPMQDGLKITLAGGTGFTHAGVDYASEDGGAADVTLSVDKAAVEDVRITLRLDGMDRLDLLEADGETFVLWLNPGDPACDPRDTTTWSRAAVNPDGTFTVTLPTGASKLDLHLPVKDDSFSNGNTAVTVTITDVHGNEAFAAGTGSYGFTVVDDVTAFDAGNVHFDASPDGPTIALTCAAAAISENGGSTEFVLTLDKPGAEDVVVTLKSAAGLADRIAVYDAAGNSPQPGESVYFKVVIDGTAGYVPLEDDGTLRIVVPAGAVSVHLPVEAVDNLISDPTPAYGMTVVDVHGAESHIGTASASLTITDHHDGPTVALAGGPAGGRMGEADGETTYNLTITPGDARNYGENLVITLTPSPVGTGSSVALYGFDYAWGDLNAALAGYSYTAMNGVLTITITPAQMAAFGDGPHTFGLPMAPLDDALVQNDHSFKLGVTVQGSEARVQAGAGSITTTLVDNDHAPTVHNETAILLWDGDPNGASLHGDLLGNDFDADGDALQLHAFNGASEYGTFALNGVTGEFDFTLNLDSARVGTLPAGGSLAMGMDASYSVDDGVNVTEGGRLHMELHKSHVFDGTGRSEDLIIQGTNSGNTITGGAGNDVIYAGKGDDILNGGNGDDIFVFSGARAGGTDVINDFDFRSASGAGPRDLIAFEDIFGDQTDMCTLSAATPSENSDGSFLFAAGDNALTVMFNNDSCLELSVNNALGRVQTITVNSNSPFYDTTATLDADLAQEIILNLIKQGM